jgi:hypothetical protein
MPDYLRLIRRARLDLNQFGGMPRGGSPVSRLRREGEAATRVGHFADYRVLA